MGRGPAGQRQEGIGRQHGRIRDKGPKRLLAIDGPKSTLTVGVISLQAWEQVSLVRAHLELRESGENPILETSRRDIEDVLYAENPQLFVRPKGQSGRQLRPIACVTSDYCPLDHQILPLGTLQHLRLVDVVVQCEQCGAILIPGFSSDTVSRVSPSDLENKSLRAPGLAARLSRKRTAVELVDIWGRSHSATFSHAAGSLNGLSTVYEAYRVRAGDTLRVTLVDEEAGRFRIEAGIIAPRDIEAVLSLLLVRGALPIEPLARVAVRDRVEVFGAYQVQLELDRSLTVDARLARTGNGWRVARSYPGLVPNYVDRANLLEFLERTRQPTSLERLGVYLQELLEAEGYGRPYPLAMAAPGLAAFFGDVEGLRAGIVQWQGPDGHMLVLLRGADAGQLVELQPAGEGSRDGLRVPDWSDVVARALRLEVQGDSRFIVHGGLVAAKSALPNLDADLMASLVERVLEAQEPLSLDQLRTYCQAELVERGDLWDFALSSCLDSDSRLVNVGDELAPLWIGRRRAPPREARYTLTDESCALGYLQITPGMRTILEALQVGRTVTFVAYGSYEVPATVDDETGRIYGPALAWEFHANGLRSGDVVRIQAPVPPGRLPRLYFIHAAQPAGEDRPPHAILARRRLDLRDRLVELLRQAGAALHVKEIARRLEAHHRLRVAGPQISATLSQNPHLFMGLPGRRKGLWGLSVWLEPGEPMNVDPTSLLLAIAEEELVLRALQQTGMPQTTEEIAQRIAEFFGIDASAVMATSFVDPKIDGLLRLRDGRWASVEWIEKWRRELRDAEIRLEETEVRRRETAASHGRIALETEYETGLGRWIEDLTAQHQGVRESLRSALAGKLAARRAGNRFLLLAVATAAACVLCTSMAAAMGLSWTLGLLIVATLAASLASTLKLRSCAAMERSRASDVEAAARTEQTVEDTVKRLEDELTATRNRLAELDACPPSGGNREASEEEEMERVGSLRELLALVDEE